MTNLPILQTGDIADQDFFEKLVAVLAEKQPNLGYVTPEMFGTISPTDAAANTIIFALAAATGKTIVLGKGRYKGDWVVNKQKLVGQGFSSGWVANGQDAATVVEGNVRMLYQASLENLNVEKSASNGISVEGYSPVIRNVGAHLNNGHGLAFTGGESDNMNHWNIDGFYTTYNTLWGVHIDHNIADGSQPNTNAGTARNIDSRGNFKGGIYINRSIDNIFTGCSFELNGTVSQPSDGYGIRLGPYARGHQFYSYYVEANQQNDVLIDAGNVNPNNLDGSGNNMFWGFRAGTANDNIVDNGVKNTIMGKIYNEPRVRKMAFGVAEFMDFDEGRFELTKTDQTLLIRGTNTDLNTKVIIENSGTGTSGLGFDSGGDNANLTGLASKDIFIDFGTVGAGSAQLVDVTIQGPNHYSWTGDVQPHSAVLPVEIILSIAYKSTNTMTVRATNVSSSPIILGGLSLWINARQQVNY